MASTSGESASKHFLILPPSDKMNSYMKRPSDESALRNTSPVDFLLDGSGHVSVTQGSPSQAYIDVIAAEALSAELRSGEMLLLPERWWHRVENVGKPGDWTAGVGYWWKLRNRS